MFLFRIRNVVATCIIAATICFTLFQIFSSEKEPFSSRVPVCPDQQLEEEEARASKERIYQARQKEREEEEEESIQWSKEDTEHRKKLNIERSSNHKKPELIHLLQRANRSHVFLEPYPHLVLPDALPEDLYQRLDSEFPSMQSLVEIAFPGASKKIYSNYRISAAANSVLTSDKVSPLWKEFIRLHISQEFMNDFFDLLAPAVLHSFPDFEKNFGKFEQLAPGIRKRKNPQEHDFENSSTILMDAQICINTPAAPGAPPVRTVHVDASRELFAGLFYMRDPRDDSTGGEFEIYRRVRTPSGQEEVQVAKRIRYQRNLLVIFINSEKALHGVTPRSETVFPRRFVNLLGHVDEKLFPDELIYPEEKLTRVGQLSKEDLKKEV